MGLRVIGPRFHSNTSAMKHTILLARLAVGSPVAHESGLESADVIADRAACVLTELSCRNRKYLGSDGNTRAPIMRTNSHILGGCSNGLVCLRCCNVQFAHPRRKLPPFSASPASLGQLLLCHLHARATVWQISVGPQVSRLKRPTSAASLAELTTAFLSL